MKINTRFLKSHPLLALIPTFTLRRLIAQAALDEYPKGTLIYSQGSVCEAIYLVISGRCESRLHSRHGSGVEAVYGPGEALGTREFLNNEPYRTTVTVLTHSILLRIPAEELERIFEAKPSLAGRFARSVFRRPRGAGTEGRGQGNFLHGFRRSFSSLAKINGSDGVKEDASLPARHGKGRASRVISLVTLARGTLEALPGHLALALQKVRPEAKVLLLEVGSDPEKLHLSAWPRLSEGCQSLGGEYCLRDYTRETDDGITEVRLSVGQEQREGAASEVAEAEEPLSELIPALLSHLGQHFDYVLVHLHSNVPDGVRIESLVQSDVDYVLFRTTTEELQAFQHLVVSLDEAQASPLRPLLYVEPYLPVSEVNEVLRQIGRPVHAFIHGAPDAAAGHDGKSSPAYQLHVNRLAREVGQCRIGIAFSSGGAKGLAHIGVIQVLEEHGIEVDVIAGSSMGAYVGAAWAHGHTGEAMERLAYELENGWEMLNLIDPVLPPRAGFMSTRRIAGRLRRAIGDAHFSSLLRSLRVVATRLDTMERVVFSTGEVAQAVEASVAIPGICTPVEVDGEMYIDGGIADPLPVDVLVEMGIERIIAVNTIPTPEQLRCRVDDQIQAQGAKPRSGFLRRVGHFLNRQLNYFAYGNILDTMFRSTHGVQMRVAESACRDADVVLWAIAADAAWHDFSNPRKYIALGRRVAEAHLSEIKSLAEGGSDASRLKTSMAAAA